MSDRNSTGFCGIDCCLCPKYHITSENSCNGCLGKNFFDKKRLCRFISCIKKNPNYISCLDCNNFPCLKNKTFDQQKSFVSHEFALKNLLFIKSTGNNEFENMQTRKEKVLRILLSKYNNGRLKSFYCNAVLELPISTLESIINESPQCTAIEMKSKIIDALKENTTESK